MKKLGLILFLILFFSLVWVNQVTMVFARPALIGKNVVQPIASLPVQPNNLNLTSSLAYTNYLPIVLYDYPPPSSKKGVGATASPTCTDLKTLRTSWYLNWGTAPDSTCGSGDAKKFVPRISNAASMSGLAVAIQNAKASGWLIGFSEPNLVWQNYMEPAQGAVLWKQIEDAVTAACLADGLSQDCIKLVSPSPNQGEPGSTGNPYGHQWTWAMVSEYKKNNNQNLPRFDAMGWNAYGSTSTEITTYLTARHNEAATYGYGDKPVWVLEYAGNCLGSVSGNAAIMSAVTPWFESTSWIGRYAWFASRLTGSGSNVEGHQNCSLINPSTGVSTSLGQIYSTY